MDNVDNDDQFGEKRLFPVRTPASILKLRMFCKVMGQDAAQQDEKVTPTKKERKKKKKQVINRVLLKVK